jgi:hypothetical protein
LLAGFGGDTAVAKGQKFNVVDTSGLTDADWAVIDRVNRACELGGAAAFWDELEKLDNVSLQLRVVGAFFPELIREVIEEEMTEQWFNGRGLAGNAQEGRKPDTRQLAHRWDLISTACYRAAQLFDLVFLALHHNATSESAVTTLGCMPGGTRFSCLGNSYKHGTLTSRTIRAFNM